MRSSPNALALQLNDGQQMRPSRKARSLLEELARTTSELVCASLSVCMRRYCSKQRSCMMWPLLQAIASTPYASVSSRQTMHILVVDMFSVSLAVQHFLARSCEKKREASGGDLPLPQKKELKVRRNKVSTAQYSTVLSRLFLHNALRLPPFFFIIFQVGSRYRWRPTTFTTGNAVAQPSAPARAASLHDSHFLLCKHSTPHAAFSCCNSRAYEQAHHVCGIGSTARTNCF